MASASYHQRVLHRVIHRHWLFSISVTSSIDAICDCDVWQIWFVDGVAVGSSLSWLFRWWFGLVKLGLVHGYHVIVKPYKSWLIVKAVLCSKSFAGCSIGITAEGKHHLDTTIGSHEQYVIISDMVDCWVSCV